MTRWDDALAGEELQGEGANPLKLFGFVSFIFLDRGRGNSVVGVVAAGVF